jgi:hypothetical protein
MAQLSRFQVDEFTLGMNNVDDPWELRPGESGFLKNVLPKEGGLVIAAREGIESFGPGIGFSGRIENLYFWDSKQLILISHFGDVWSAPAATGVCTQRRVGTAGDFVHPWCFEIMKDVGGTERIFMVNGTDTPQVWDGAAASTSNWSTLGAGVPPNGCTWIRLWKNRMVAGGNAAFPERVYYSDIGNPASPNPWNFVDLRSAYDDSDAVSWAELVGDNLIVFKPKSTWVVYDSNTFANRRIGAPGCAHPFMSCEFRNRVYFVSATGLYSTNGEEAPVAEPRKLTVFDLDTPDLSSKGTRVVLDMREERILILLPVVVGVGDAPLFYRFVAYYPPGTRNNPHKEGTYFLFELTPSMSSLAFVRLGNDPGNELVMGDMTNGLLWHGFSGNVDGEFAISSAWETGWIRLHPEERFERLRRLNIRGSSTEFLTFMLRATTGGTLWTEDRILIGTELNVFRPEVRSQQHKIVVVGTGAWSIRDMELVFRGGKEH